MEVDRVRFRTTECVLVERTARELEKLAGQPGLAEQVLRTSEVLVLDAPRTSVVAGGVLTILKLRIGEDVWRMRLHPPPLPPRAALSALPVIVSCTIKGSKAAASWRLALRR